MVLRSFMLTAAAATAAITCRGAQAAYTLDLASNPLANPANIQGPDTANAAARFAYHANGTLTAVVNTSLPTIKLLQPLGTTLTQNDNFSFAFPLMLNPGFQGAPEQTGQFSVGLVNSVTTGSNRTGNPADYFGDTFDVVSLDYFPNHSVYYGGPTLTPTFITSSTGAGDTDALNFDNPHLFYTYGAETDLSAEGSLPVGQPLTFVGSYDVATRTLTARVLDGSTALAINTVGNNGVTGGFDGDVTTIQSVLPAGQAFAVDSLAIALWNDGWTTAAAPSVTGTVTFGTPVPEPATLGLLLPAALLFVRRR